VESNEPSHQQIIEAHLHLLLDGKSQLDIIRALRTVMPTYAPNNYIVPGSALTELRDDVYRLHGRLQHITNVFNNTNQYRPLMKLLEEVITTVGYTMSDAENIRMKLTPPMEIIPGA